MCEKQCCVLLFCVMNMQERGYKECLCHFTMINISAMGCLSTMSVFLEYIRELQKIYYANFRSTIAASNAIHTTNTRSIHGDGGCGSTTVRVGTASITVRSGMVVVSDVIDAEDEARGVSND